MTEAHLPAERLLADFAARKPAALARVISVVENHRAGADAILAALHARTGRARRAMWFSASTTSKAI